MNMTYKKCKLNALKVTAIISSIAPVSATAGSSIPPNSANPEAEASCLSGWLAFVVGLPG